MVRPRAMRRNVFGMEKEQLHGSRNLGILIPAHWLLHNMCIQGCQLRQTFHQGEHFSPSKIVAAFEVTVNSTNQAKILRRIQGPAITAVVLLSANRRMSEDIRALIEQ